MLKFLVDIIVEGVEYKADDVVPAEKIPAGSLEVLLRQRRVEPVEAVTVAELQTPLKTSAEQPQPAAKRK